MTKEATENKESAQRAESLGELNDFTRAPGESGGNASTVLISCEAGGDQVSQSVHFVVNKEEDDSGSQSNSSLVLCWADPEGKLHHHYTYEGSVLDHEEQTYVGDAFVVYQTSADNDEKPRTTSDLLRRNGDGNDGNTTCQILFSYRLKQTINNSTHVHRVEYSVSGGCRAMRDPKNDDEYRIIAGLPQGHSRRLPPPEKSWEITYAYDCPPIPCSSTWNVTKETFYVWGDVDFDDYGASHLMSCDERGVDMERIRSVHDCRMNQIVPQVMIGNCLCENDEACVPSWKVFDTWVIQAQYFWMDRNGSPRAQCGSIVEVLPGDEIYTRIRYSHETAQIAVSIAVLKEDEDGTKREDVNKRSQIVLERPFPHDPSLFENWRDFFRKCVGAERAAKAGDDDVVGGETTAPIDGGCLARPYLNVEYKGRVNVETLRSICPFVVKEMCFPSSEPGSNSNWKARLFSPRTGMVDVLEGLDKGNTLHVAEAITLGASNIVGTG